MAELVDPRTPLWRRFFEAGKPYEEYLATASEAHRTKWEQAATRIALSAEQSAQLATWKREMRVLVLSGTWCGDCARQGPMLYRIAQSCPAIHLRFIDNRENPELADELRIHGASRVPTALLLSEDYFEVARFGDKTLSALRRKYSQELGPACDAGIVPPSPAELAFETLEWVEFLERGQLMLRLSPFLRERHKD